MIVSTLIKREKNLLTHTLITQGQKLSFIHREKPSEEMREEDEDYGKTPLMDIRLPSSPPLQAGSYAWPPLPAQSPYASMAMMLYKDPAMIYGPLLAKQAVRGEAGLYGDRITPLSTAQEVPIILNLNQKFTETTQAAPAASMSATTVHETCSNGNNVNGTKTLGLVGGNAATINVNDDLSPNSIGQTHGGSENANCSSTKVLFPDGVSEGLPAMIAKAGVSNLPNRTAFMMLTTIELQETI